MRIEVADIEVYPNFFLYVGHNTDDEGSYEYSLHSSDSENTIGEFCDRMRNQIAMIGFNNSEYDYPVIHYILKHETELHRSTSEEVCEAIHNYSKYELIESEDRVWIPYNDIIVPQMDLRKIHHFDNPARMTSLKALELAMRMENIEDLPYPPDMRISKEESLNVIDYCHHDVKATKLFYQESKEQIDFRKRISQKYDHSMINYSDVKIGEYINRKTYERLSGRKYHEFKKQRTYRKRFNVRELIPDFVSFKTPELQSFLKEVSSVSFGPDDKFQRDIVIGGLEITFAKGGLHSKDKACIIKRKDDHILQEKDVGSMYPASIINAKLYPRHLGVEWTKGIKELFDRRNYELKPLLKTLEKGSAEYEMTDADQSALKLAMNGGGYGKTGSSFSWQYDPMVIMKTTFLGQLSLIMLCERMHLIGVQLISANTDGIVIQYHKDQKDAVNKVHKEWEEITGYILEDTDYERIFFSNVNNYLAEIIDSNGDIVKHKYKGTYEIDKDWHKNHSNRIVSIAVARACLFEIPPEDTIRNHMNIDHYDDIGVDAHGIYDFCSSVRARGGAKYETESLVNGSHTIVPVQKTNRYFVSNDGVRLRKILPPDENKKDVLELEPANQLNIFDFVEDVKVEKERVSYIEAGHNVTMFNRAFDGPYDLNFEYYLKECNKILEQL